MSNIDETNTLISKKDFNSLKLHKKNNNSMNKDNNNSNEVVKINPLHNVISYSQMKQKEKKGNSIYKKNDFLSKIYDIMKYQPFNDFFNTYIKDFSDIQVAMLYFYLYATIERHFVIHFNRPIKRGEMVYMLKEIMSNSNMRKYFIYHSEKNNMIQCNNTTLNNTSHKTIQNNLPKNISIEEDLLITDLQKIFEKNSSVLQ